MRVVRRTRTRRKRWISLSAAREVDAQHRSLKATRSAQKDAKAAARAAPKPRAQARAGDIARSDDLEEAEIIRQRMARALWDIEHARAAAGDTDALKSVARSLLRDARAGRIRDLASRELAFGMLCAAAI